MAGTRVIKFFGLYILQADEVGVVLTLGKYSGTVRPGLGFGFPFLQQVVKTKSSLQTVDLPDQQVVLSGNIAITISGNLNFRVTEPAKALLQVADYRYSVQRLALTTISDVLGTKTIEEVRTEKTKLADEIEDIVADQANAWGLADVDIRLTDARVDEALMRAMMRETEAQKEASASRIRAEADEKVASSFARAARTLSDSPGALTLRVLQTLGDLSNAKSTIVVPLPWDLLAGSGGGGLKQLVADGAAANALAAPVTDATEATAPDSVPPLCKVQYQGDRTVALCPQCGAQYNVTDAVGNMRYDQMSDVPGVQIKCKRCDTVFTLPGSE